jgi:hypothetical protein
VGAQLTPPTHGAYTGDPLVDWVDSMLYNNGQPLAVGSARLYGGDGNSNAFEALYQATVLSYQLVQNVAGLIPGPFGLGLNLAFAINAAMEGDWTGLAMFAVQGVAHLNPCGLGGSIVRGAAAANLVMNVYQFGEGLQSGDPFVGFRFGNAMMDLHSLLSACFTGEMLVDVEGGKKRADAVVEGDLLWSRDEFDPNGPLVLKRVEERFVRVSPVLHVRVVGRVLRTTGEHPLWVANRGRWLPARELKVGDLLRTRCGSLVAVEGLKDSGQVETVYNWRIADYHTYRGRR